MIIYAVQIIASLALIISVLLQAQGGGLSPAFGGGGEMYRSKQSIEKILMFVTGISAFFLAATSIYLLIP